jgi:hypothetical protein
MKKIIAVSPLSRKWTVNYNKLGISTVASSITGGIVLLATFPIDPVTTHFQTSASSTIPQSIKHVWNTKTLYSGVLVPFGVACVRRFITLFPIEGGKQVASNMGLSETTGSLVGSLIGSIVESLLTTPAEQFKINTQFNIKSHSFSQLIDNSLKNPLFFIQNT